MPSLFPGYSPDAHNRMLEVYHAGLSHGTWKNKSVQVRRYLLFASECGFDPRSPNQYDVLSYLLRLKETLSSPGAALNYVSGAKSWVLLAGGDTAPFDSYATSLMKRGVRRTSAHVPRPAPPLTSTLLLHAVDYLRRSGTPALVLVSSLLVGFASLLRQGNLLGAVGASSHALRCSDVSRSAGGLRLIIRSTKTRWRSSPPFTIWIPALADPRCCPVAAWDAYASVYRPAPSGPAFILPPGGPLLPATLVAALRLALTHLAVPEAQSYTLHSLRRGGAQACAAAGCSLEHIKDLGAWSSDAVHKYVPSSMME